MAKQCYTIGQRFHRQAGQKQQNVYVREMKEKRLKKTEKNKLSSVRIKDLLLIF